MYKISIYGCAMFKKLVCQWVNQFISRLPNSTALNLKEKSVRYDFVH